MARCGDAHRTRLGRRAASVEARGRVAGGVLLEGCEERIMDHGVCRGDGSDGGGRNGRKCKDLGFGRADNCQLLDGIWAICAICQRATAAAAHGLGLGLGSSGSVEAGAAPPRSLSLSAKPERQGAVEGRDGRPTYGYGVDVGGGLACVRADAVSATGRGLPAVRLGLADRPTGGGWLMEGEEAGEGCALMAGGIQGTKCTLCLALWGPCTQRERRELPEMAGGWAAKNSR